MGREEERREEGEKTGALHIGGTTAGEVWENGTFSVLDVLFQTHQVHPLLHLYLPHQIHRLHQLHPQTYSHHQLCSLCQPYRPVQIFT